MSLFSKGKPERTLETVGVEAKESLKRHGQVVLVFQGGGALGAYQVGVYEALHEAGVEPDWLIGTSIGAINASIIAGNAPENRMARLREFWSRVEHTPALNLISSAPWAQGLPNWSVITSGVAGFFKPNPLAFVGAHIPLPPDAAGYYSTKPLEQTLKELVDFDLVNQRKPRLTVGAACVRNGEMRYFDSRETPLNVRHIMASGALPPAFPAVRIDGELYWDGGILSNTPVEAVFDDFPRRSSTIFAVHIWNPNGPEPGSIRQVLNRQKDIQYASRAASHIKRQKELHNMRRMIKGLIDALPPTARNTPLVEMASNHGCLTRMHVVRLLAPTLDNEDHTKDIDFSAKGIHQRWEAGYNDTRKMLAARPWTAELDPFEGFHLHELRPDEELPLAAE